MFGTKRLANKMFGGLNIVKLTLYKVLVDDLSKKYQKAGEEFYKTLAAIIVNEIFGCHNSKSQEFFAKNEKTVIEEIKNLGVNHPELKRAMTDSLRVSVLSNTMLKYGLKIFLKCFRKNYNIDTGLFDKAIDRGIFIQGGDSPHMQSFLDMTTKLGKKYGIIKESDGAKNSSHIVNSFSNKINLRVNGYSIVLKQRLNVSELGNHNIKKAGLILRLILIFKMFKILRDGTIFWSKNCELKYIEENLLENNIFPNLNTQSGANFMWGTSAFLFYKEEKLFKFIFQIIGNQSLAKVILEKLEKALVKIFGDYSSTDMLNKVWENEDEQLILKYPTEITKSGSIHLLIK